MAKIFKQDFLFITEKSIILLKNVKITDFAHYGLVWHKVQK